MRRNGNSSNNTNRVRSNMARRVRVIVLRPGQRLLVIAPRRRRKQSNNTPPA